MANDHLSDIDKDVPHVLSAFGHKIEPTSRIIFNATITAPTYDPIHGTFGGAVYDHSGALSIESLRPAAVVRGHRCIDPVSIPQGQEIEAHIPQAIYAGHFFYFWGHFLIETLSTARLAPTLPLVPVIFSPFQFVEKTAWTENFERHARPLVKASGWDGRDVIIMRSALKVSRLHVPQRLTAFGNRTGGTAIHPEISYVYERIRSKHGKPVQAGRRVLVMRADTHRRRHPAEKEIYQFLVSRGFDAIHPERLSSEEQVAQIANAEILVGFTGSCLHNSAFLAPGGQVIEIGDDPSKPSSPVSTQIDLCRACHQRLMFVRGFDPAPRLASAIICDILDNLNGDTART